MTKKLLSLRHLLNRLVSEGKLGSEDRDKLKKALEELSRAIDTRNIKGVEKAVGKISAVLLKNIPHP